jgi:hypothetical protein
MGLDGPRGRYRCCGEDKYDGRLQSSWNHLITPSRNFVEVRWRSLFRTTSLDKRCTTYNTPPTSRKRAADRWSLRNFLPWSSRFMVGKPQKSHGARSVLGLEKVDRWNPIQSRSRPMWFLGFSNHKKGAPRQEISMWSTVCSTFSRSGWSVVRSASLSKAGTSKKRPSPHLHKVPTRSNKASPRTLQRPSYNCPYLGSNPVGSHFTLCSGMRHSEFNQRSVTGSKFVAGLYTLIRSSVTCVFGRRNTFRVVHIYISCRVFLVHTWCGNCWLCGAASMGRLN